MQSVLLCCMTHRRVIVTDEALQRTMYCAAASRGLAYSHVHQDSYMTQFELHELRKSV